MIKSIRLRLTLWYVGFLSVVLIAFSAGVYSLLAAGLFGRLDARLLSALDVTASSLRHEIEEHRGQRPGEEAFRGVLTTVHQATLANQAVAIFQGPRLVAAKAGPDGQLPPALLGAGSPEIRKISVSGSRAVVHEIPIPGAGNPYRFVVSEPEAATLRELQQLRQIIAIAIPFSLALAAAGGYLLARKSLAPVVAMSASVDRISSHNLHQRIGIPNEADELGRLGATFNRLLGRLEDAFSQQRRFMADASHELRTPLSVAHTAAQVTLEKDQRSEQEYREALRITEEQTSRLMRVVRQMFLLARADSGALPLTRTPFYLDELLNDAARAARVLGQSKGVIVASPPLAESPCTADEDLIRQLVMILLDNAVKFTPPGGSVDLELRREVGGYVIAVSDTGRGIPDAAKSRVFERFSRVDEARTNTADSGAGLGLAIGKWIAEAHQGELRLVSSTPRGTTFAAYLPQSLVPAHDRAPDGEVQTPAG